MVGSYTAHFSWLYTNTKATEINLNPHTYIVCSLHNFPANTNSYTKQKHQLCPFDTQCHQTVAKYCDWPTDVQVLYVDREETDSGALTVTQGIIWQVNRPQSSVDLVGLDGHRPEIHKPSGYLQTSNTGHNRNRHHIRCQRSQTKSSSLFRHEKLQLTKHALIFYAFHLVRWATAFIKSNTTTPPKSTLVHYPSTDNTRTDPTDLRNELLPLTPVWYHPDGLHHTF